MKKRKNQEEIVKEVLLKNNIITRNQAISMGITRLGAIIDKLKNKGYAIEGFWIGNEKKDYGYRLKSVMPLNKVTFKINFVGLSFSNLKELEERIMTLSSPLKEKGEEVVLINVFEPVLDILSKIFDLPKRNIVILSEKPAYINKTSFNIMNVFNHIKEMFYKEGKKRYLKNRVERLIQKTRNKYADGDNIKINIFVYGFNKEDENDIKFLNFLKKNIKG